MSNRSKRRQRRVTLALKWHYLDNLSPQEIRDRFEAEGIGDYTVSTIRDYLNEEPADEVIEQIEAEHANVRLQIAERQERMFQRAREAESQATEDEPIKRVVPQTTTARERQFVQAWELVEDPDARPDWATGRDVIIRFVDDEREVLEGQQYPVKALDGSPRYTTEFVGLRRDQPDLQGQAMARQEQSSHLQAKGDVLGVYKEQLEIDATHDGSVTVEHDVDEETEKRIGNLFDTLTEETDE
ncbi:MAG: hypothetical protein V5A34_05650 [Halapricum sp.]